MASTFLRSIKRSSISSLRSHFSKPNIASLRSPQTNSFATDSAFSPIRPFRAISRSPVELGSCSGSMYPLHSAVASSRLTSRLSFTSQSCRDISQGTLCRTSPSL